MSLLLESICLNQGVFRNLSYHEARMRKAVIELFGKKLSVDLQTLLTTIKIPKEGLHKVRILYDTEIRTIEFSPYTIKAVRSLKLIQDDSISYEYKFSDRSALDNLYAQRGESDDIIIVKNGCITDSHYANIIFRKGNVWFTPRTCLLKGTMRQYLLDEELIVEADIDLKNYFRYECCKLVNAMLGMNAQEIEINAIV